MRETYDNNTENISETESPDFFEKLSNYREKIVSYISTFDEALKNDTYTPENVFELLEEDPETESHHDPIYQRE